MSFTNTLYPQIWQMATAMLSRTPQAILLSGVEGLGKLQIALELANWLLCESVSAKLKTIYTPNQNLSENQVAELNDLDLIKAHCGKCVSCKLFASRQNMDLQILYPQHKNADLSFWWGNYPIPVIDSDEETEKRPKNVIPVDDIRALDKFINLSSFQGGLRVIIIWPADAMNNASANALLKNLEEPTRNLIYILATDHKDRLPVTIHSRCREIHINAPDINTTLKWSLANISKIQNLPANINEQEISELISVLGAVPIRIMRWLSYYPLFENMQKIVNEEKGLVMMNTANEISEFIRGSRKKTTENEFELDKSLNLEEVLNLFHRLLLQKIINHTIEQSSTNKTSNSKCILDKVHRLYKLIDEIIFFKRHIVYTINPRQVFERLLLKLAVINKL